MTVRPIPSRRSGVLCLLAAAAMLVLSGCGGVHPGVAAAVGPAMITRGEVDKVAAVLCSANSGGAEAQGRAAPALSTKGARVGALQVLVESELSRLFGESVGVQPDAHKVSQALAQNEQGIALLPEDQRADFRDVLKQYTEGQLILVAAGRQSLAKQGKDDVTDQEALAEGSRLRGEFVDGLDIAIDPRYGTFAHGRVQAGGAELSVAESKGARAAGKQQPPASWVSSLPATQKCA